MSLDPWSPPKSELGAEPARGVGLIRAVLEGLFGALLLFMLVGFGYGLYLAISNPEFQSMSFQEGMSYEQRQPHVLAVARIIRAAIAGVGGAFAAHRYRGRWFVSSAALGVLMLLALAAPVVFVGTGVGTLDLGSIASLLPAAILGGALGRRRDR